MLVMSSPSESSTLESKSSSSDSLEPLAESTKQKVARRAFASQDAEASIAIHNASVGNAKEKHKRSLPSVFVLILYSGFRGGDFLSSIVYGGMDGIITTFAVCLLDLTILFLT